MSSLVAAASSGSGSGNLLIFALPLLLIGWMFFTQRRRVKESQRLQSTLGVGDEVTTTSGLLGRITELEDEIATLEVSPGVNIRFNRRAIAGPAPTASAASSASASPTASASPHAPASPTASAASEPETDMPSDPHRITD